MTVWIIGAFGMLGSAVASAFEKKGLKTLKTGRQDADIGDIDALRSFSENKGVTHIINCAAYTKVDLAEKEEALAFRINAKGPENVGRIAMEIGAKVLHFSTDYVFDGTSETPYFENIDVSPMNVYGKSKSEGEQRLLKTFPQACIIRTSWLFGLNGENFISKMLHLMETKKELRVVQDQFGRPTFCEDLAQAAVLLLDASGTFHFANREATNWYEFTRSIYDEAKKSGFSVNCEKIIPVSSDQFPTLAKRPQYSVLDTTKIEGVLGLSPRPWKEALKDYIHQYFQTLCQ